MSLSLEHAVYRAAACVVVDVVHTTGVLGGPVVPHVVEPDGAEHPDTAG